MSCKHDCDKTPVFPLAVYNRRGLDRIQYRIGDYYTFREHMLDRLNNESALSAWTHRQADDPGIALLEGAATVAEILCFYQTLYANETYLRTAHWRESVTGLVALTGYRTAPGVGGKATICVAISGEQPVVIPPGFGFKAQLKDQDSPSIFESVEAVTAYPALGQFSLYRSRLTMQSIARGMTELELHSVQHPGEAIRSDIASLAAVDLSTGDRIILVPDTSAYDSGGGTFDAASGQDAAETVIVSEIEQTLDRIIVRFEGSLTVDRDTTVRAYKVDRSFRHLGFFAPNTIGILDETTGLMSIEATAFSRSIDRVQTWSGENAGFYSDVDELDIPLDVEVDDLAVGGKLICQGRVDFDGLTSPVRFTVVRDVTEIRPDTFVWGGMSSGCTVVSLLEGLIPNADIPNQTTDIRRLHFHEALGPELTFRAPTQWQTGSYGFDTTVFFFGTYEEARTLANRQLLLQGPDGELQDVQVETEVDQFDLTAKDEENPWPWEIELDRPPVFDSDLFDEVENRVTVYGNLIPCDQGETQKETIIGSGDARQIFQTFEIPKAPLTYFLDPDSDPAQVPELEVYVDGILWQRVDSFFGHGPKNRVYVVREDDDENSYVQFGDGQAGARLLSGHNNVGALYRTGVGAANVVEPDALPAAIGKLKELDGVFMPGPAVGGSDRETEKSAREAAPGRMQSLGRLVSLSDYEAEALGLPGVLKARAAWSLVGAGPVIRLTVLTENGLPEEAEEVGATIRSYNRCRGPARHVVVSDQGIRQFVYLIVAVIYARDRRPDDVEEAVLKALGVTGEEDNGIDAAEGLFGLDSRQFGQSVHVSQVLGWIQQVDGVAWVRVDSFEPIDLGTPVETNPFELVAPAVPVRLESVSCHEQSILTLHQSHLVIRLAKEQGTEECE